MSYRLHVPAPPGSTWNAKPTHQAWCTLLTLLHAWSQSASVPLRLGVLTRNHESKSASAIRRQRFAFAGTTLVGRTAASWAAATDAAAAACASCRADALGQAA